MLLLSPPPDAINTELTDRKKQHNSKSFNIVSCLIFLLFKINSFPSSDRVRAFFFGFGNTRRQLYDATDN